MNIQKMRVMVDSNSQMRIALTILSEITGRTISTGYGIKSIEEVVEEWPAPNVVGIELITGGGISTWGRGHSSGNISFKNFMLEVAKMDIEGNQSWKIGCRTLVAEKEGLRILEDDILVPKFTLKEMLAAIK